MAVTVTRGDGVTKLTFKTDAKSACPPFCQILKELCYNPLCCGVSQYLKTRSMAALGTLQVAVAVMTICLSAILSSTPGSTWWQMDYTGFPFWLGGLFIAFGIFSLISERFSSPCLVTINTILQLLGVCFGIAAVVLFSINITQVDLWDFCRLEPDYDYYYNRRHHEAFQTTTLSPQVQKMKQKCMNGKDMLLMLIIGINAVLIVLSALQLCITISSATFGIKALKNREKKQKESAEDPEHYKPLLEEVNASTD